MVRCPLRADVFVMHPHGIISFSAWLTFATDALGFGRLFPGVRVHGLTLRINFFCPLAREYLLLHGGRAGLHAGCAALHAASAPSWA